MTDNEELNPLEETPVENDGENTGGSGEGEESYTPGDMFSDDVDWELYKILLNGSEDATQRDSIIKDSVAVFEEGIINDPAYQEDATTNGESTPMAISRKSPIEAEMRAVPGTDVDMGDIVSALGGHWIAVEVYEDQLGIVHGTLWLCNYILKFQNNSDTVYERYCVVDDGSYSKRSVAGVAYQPRDTLEVVIGIDDKTSLLHLDKRLGIGESTTAFYEPQMNVYKIYGIDSVSKNFGDESHLMKLFVQRDVYNKETDSMVLGVCDVYHDDGSSSGGTTTGSCAIVGKDNIRTGTARKFSVAFYDGDGHEASGEGASIVWTVSIPTGSNAQYSIADGICTVSVPLSGSEVGNVITLDIADANGIYGISQKKVTVISVG